MIDPLLFTSLLSGKPTKELFHKTAVTRPHELINDLAF
jgi:hypothetical protein